jgi:hypothetical protein
MADTDWLPNAMVQWLTGLAILILPSIFVILFGSYAPTSGRYQRLVFGIGLLATVCCFLITTVSTFTAGNGVLNPNLYVQGFPESGVMDEAASRPRSFCPYAVFGIPPLLAVDNDTGEGIPFPSHPVIPEEEYNGKPPIVIPEFPVD